jgi:diacylglycerol O-acyltransferase
MADEKARQHGPAEAADARGFRAAPAREPRGRTGRAPAGDGGPGMTEPIRGQEQTFLIMDEAPSWAMINVMFITDRPMEAGQVERLIEDRFLRFPRFRLKVAAHDDGHYWESVDELDVSRHIRVDRLATGGGKAALSALIGENLSAPIDVSRPQWEFLLVPGYGDRGVLILRIHHVYGDGRCLAEVIEAITAPTREGSLARLERGQAGEDEAPAGLVRREPTEGAIGLKDFLAKRWNDVRTLAKLLTLRRESQTGFEGRPSLRKRVAFSEPVPLDGLKQAARRLRCTANDLLLSAVAGAVRARLLREGASLRHVRYKLGIPVDLHSRRSIRDLESRGALRNVFGSVILELKPALADPVERTLLIHHAMRKNLKSSEAHWSFRAMCRLGSSPPGAVLSRMQTSKPLTSGIVSTLSGPTSRRYMAGSEVEEAVFWTPTPRLPGTALGVGILIYAGHVQFGISVADNAPGDPEEVTRDIRHELNSLVETIIGRS